MALNSPERLVSVSAASAPSVEQDLEAVLDGLYSGPKSALRPLHEALMRQIKAVFDPDGRMNPGKLFV